MLLNEKTLEVYGYTFESISEKSNKLLIVTCDYCNKEYTVSKKNRHNNHLVINKDACKKCKYIKMKEINNIKYGVDSVSKLQTVKDKIKSTNMEKYGGIAPACNQEIIEKAKNTNLERYGATTYIASEQGQQAYKKTMQEKYGVDNPSQLSEFQQKKKETFIQKYGETSFLTTEECKEATIKKFGVDNVFKMQEFQDKAIDTMYKKYGVKNLLQIPKIAKSINNKSIETKKEKGLIQVYKERTIPDWAEITGFSKSHFSVLVKRYGWDSAVNMTPKMSSIEKIIEEFLISEDIKYEKQIKIGKFKADFVINKLILELDGLYWHSEHNKHKNYHSDKRQFYIENGYQPLFFREDEIINKFNIVKSMILNKLGKSNRIFARKLKFSEISKKDGGKFLKENHLMGSGSGKCLALIGDQIYCVMRIKKIKGGYEISRFANKTGYTVVGGFSKLLSFTDRPLTTFIDLRYGLGNPSIFGFEYCGTNLSFKWTDGSMTYNRMQFPSNSGYNYNLFKIWDCGQAKWRITN